MAKKVMVFGVFDGIHEGHRAFFKEVKKHGRYLIVAVAQDHVVEYLKGRLPQRNLARRIDDLRKEPAVDEVALGDAELGTYEVVKKFRPSVIALGYDQQALKEDLESWLKKFDPFDKPLGREPLGTELGAEVLGAERLRAGWKPKIIVLKAYEPHKYKSSLLKKGRV